jgi:predicted nucleotidyltransferase
LEKDNNPESPATESPFERLQKKAGVRWTALEEARRMSLQKRAEIQTIISNERLLSSETSLILYGSLARMECTPGSDVDWTLLIDGQADPKHLSLTHGIESALKAAKLADPNPRGAFGNMIFSHDLIHKIGGEDDTNHNTTQRILLLLESTAVGQSEAYERVLRGILRRYLEEDSHFSNPSTGYLIPRFLLNDIVRYWRTVAVDYANKRRERPGGGWAIRNIKLRMSRKLMFLSGLLMCFNCHLRKRDSFEGTALEKTKILADQLLKDINQTPIDILAEAFLDYGKLETATKAFGAYEEYMSSLQNPEIRESLKKLSYQQAGEDASFLKLRNIGHDFQNALTGLFFEDNPMLKKITQEYGVF